MSLQVQALENLLSSCSIFIFLWIYCSHGGWVTRKSFSRDVEGEGRRGLEEPGGAWQQRRRRVGALKRRLNNQGLVQGGRPRRGGPRSGKCVQATKTSQEPGYLLPWLSHGDCRWYSFLCDWHGQVTFLSLDVAICNMMRLDLAIPKALLAPEFKVWQNLLWTKPAEGKSDGESKD